MAFQLDPIVSLSFALAEHPGYYALMLGSGVSRAAGIPTGWEVILELTRRVAVAHGDDVPDDPAQWYTEKFGREPDYSELLEMLASTRAERMSLLRQFFEPTEDERDRGIKQPTAAHAAIANLAARGHVRVILTTNFDRLIEQALQAEGLQPTIVSSPEQIEGALPIQHIPCLLIKIHGDYLDTRIRNIASELEQYDPATVALLDRVFSEFGLVTCGWSAAWDVALRRAIDAATNRFSMYFMTRGEVGPEAAALIQRRGGRTLSISSSDSAFVELRAKVHAIEASRKPHPLSLELLIAEAKRVVVGDDNRIALHDLVIGEMNKCREAVAELESDARSIKPTDDAYAELVGQVADLTSGIASIGAVLGAWGSDHADSLLLRSIASLSKREATAGYQAWRDLAAVAPCLLFYTSGMAAVFTGNRRFLGKLLGDLTVSRDGRDRPSCRALAAQGALRSGENLVRFDDGRSHRTAASEWVSHRLSEWIPAVLGTDVDTNIIMDRFDTLVALVSCIRQDVVMRSNFMWRGLLHDDANTYVKELGTEVDRETSEHWLVKCGIAENPLGLLGAVDKLQAECARFGY